MSRGTNEWFVDRMIKPPMVNGRRRIGCPSELRPLASF